MGRDHDLGIEFQKKHMATSSPGRFSLQSRKKRPGDEVEHMVLCEFSFIYAC